MIDEQMEFKENIYFSLLGQLKEPLPDVENLFSNGEKCAELNEQVYHACQRLCTRLGEYEDRDVEIIIRAMFNIQKEIAFKMYDYGAKFKIVCD